MELVAPGDDPRSWGRWTEKETETFRLHHDVTRWRLIYEGIGSGTGPFGHDVSDEEAQRIRDAFLEPGSYERIHRAGFYDDAGYCAGCDKPYCYEHWRVSNGYGRCPMGHGKSLDPHWYPEDLWDDP